MYCRNCGQENKQDAAFCRGCGMRIATLGAQPQEAPAEEPTPVVTEPEAPKKEKKRGKKARWIVLIVVVLAAAAVLTGLFFYHRRDRYGSTSFYQWWSNEDGGYTIFYKGAEIYEADGSSGVSITMDGKTATFRDEGDLYLAKGKKVKRIVKDVSGWRMAESGNAIAYEKDGRLYCYSCLTGRSKKIAKDVADYEISYNGKYVAYSKSTALYIWDGRRDGRVAYAKEGETLKLQIWSVSNDGLIYAVSGANPSIPGTGDLLSFTRTGKLTKVKENVIQFHDGWYEMNRAKDQLIFYGGDPDVDGEGFYVSVNGGEAVKLDLTGTSNSLDIVGGYEHSVKDLRGQIYKFAGDTLFRLNENWKVEMILDETCVGSSRAYDNSAVYAKDNKGTLYKINQKTGAKKVIAEEVKYVSAAGFGFVYFTDEDDTLYRNNKKHEVAGFVDQFVGKNGGGVLYMDEDQDLYSAGIFGRGREIEEDVWRMERSGKNIIYYKKNEDESNRSDVYFSKNGNRFKKIRGVYGWYQE